MEIIAKVRSELSKPQSANQILWTVTITGEYVSTSAWSKIRTHKPSIPWN